MEENKIMEEINGETIMEVCNEVTTSNSNILVKVAVVAVVAAVGVGATIFYKKKKAQKTEEENVEVIPSEDQTESIEG